MKKWLILFFAFSSMNVSVVQANSEQYIEEKYLPMFEDIEKQAIISLDQLIDEAYIEYVRKKEKGEITLPLLLSYIEKGKALEEEIDQKFQRLYTAMRNEIKESGLPDSVAKPYEKQYIKSKRSSKLQILKNIALEGHTISFERKQ